MLKTLGLDDDMDPVDAVEVIERAFDVKFQDEEVRHIYTVGEMHDLVLRKLPRGGNNGKCASAMTFYRLRRALSELRDGERLSLRFDLTYFDQRPTKAFFRELERATGLNLPHAAASWVGRLAGTIAILTFIGFFLGVFLFFLSSILLGIDVARMIPVQQLGLAFMGSLLVGGLATWIDPGRLPSDCRTLSELAQQTATLSFGELVRLGAGAREHQVWEVLTTILAKLAHVPADQIERGTFFLDSPVKRASMAA